MNFPFFTSPDDALLRGESTRDPLGLVSIWSNVGHRLIPGLATVVSRIDGIQGILFLATAINCFSSEFREKMGDGKIFTFLERLWEYHLHVSGRKPCFGTNRLNSLDFQLSFGGAGIVGTGLRQYYRGTCINKGILSDDLQTLNQPWREIALNLFDTPLKSWFNTKAPQNTTFTAATVYKTLQKSLDRFSQGIPELYNELYNALLDDAHQHRWIEFIRQEVPDRQSENLSTKDLVRMIQGYSKTQDDCEHWVDACQTILDCEPFLQVVECAFIILQEHPRSSLEDISNRLESSAPRELLTVCRQFENVRLSAPLKRLDDLHHMASQLKMRKYRDFVEYLLKYYAGICQTRGKSPLVKLDGNNVIVMLPTTKRVDWKESSNAWVNQYFIKTQLKLYDDLMSRRGDVTHE